MAPEPDPAILCRGRVDSNKLSKDTLATYQILKHLIIKLRLIIILCILINVSCIHN